MATVRSWEGLSFWSMGPGRQSAETSPKGTPNLRIDNLTAGWKANKGYFLGRKRNTVGEEGESYLSSSEQHGSRWEQGARSWEESGGGSALSRSDLLTRTDEWLNFSRMLQEDAMPSFANWFTNEEGIDKYGCKFEGTDGKPHISQRSEEEQRQAAAFCARYLRRHLQEWERQRRTSKGKEDAGAPEDAGVPGDAPSEELGDEDGEVDLDETQVYLSNTNFVFALETLRSVPPRVAVRHHQTVATLLAGCRHDISKRGGEYDAVLSLQTLAYMGPQTVAEHFEEIIETGILGRSRRAGEPWPERYVPPPRPTERSCQGEGGLDCVQHLQLQKPWLRYECAKAVWLALSVLEPEHLLALEAQGQPPVTELARRGLIHIDTAREALNSMSGPSVHMANLVDAIEQGVEKARAERGGSLPGYSADVVTDPESMLSTFRAERVAWSRELHTSFPPAVREYAWRLYLIGGELERRGFLNSQLWCDVIMPLVVTAAVRRAGIDPPPNFLPDEEVDLSDLSAEEVDMLRAPPGQRCSAYLESTRPAREAEEAAKEAQKARQREDGKRYYAERKARLEMPFSQLSGEFAMAEGCLHKLIYAMDQVAQGAEVDFKLLEEEAESVRREFERLKRAGQERVKAGVGSENEDLRLAAERRAAVALQVRQVLRYPERARSSARKLVLREEGRRQEEEKELRMRSILREFQLKLDKVKWDLQRVSQLIEAPDGVWMSNLHMQVDLHSQVERTWHDALRLSEASRERANIEGGAAFAQLAPEAPAAMGGEGYYFFAASDESQVFGPFADEASREKKIGDSLSFRKIIIRQCQREFEADAALAAIQLEADADEAAQEAARASGEAVPKETVRAWREREKEREYRLGKVKRRTLSNVSFIGQLFLVEQLSTRTICHCADKLLHTKTVPLLDESGAPRVDASGRALQGREVMLHETEDADIDALCRLLVAVGPAFQAQEARTGGNALAVYVSHLEKLRDMPNLSARVRFLCQDVVDAARAGWELRDSHVAARSTTMSKQEFREAAAAEERERSREAAAQMRKYDQQGGGRAGGRRGRAGGRSGRGFMEGGTGDMRRAGASRHASGGRAGGRPGGGSRGGGGGLGGRLSRDSFRGDVRSQDARGLGRASSTASQASPLPRSPSSSSPRSSPTAAGGGAAGGGGGGSADREAAMESLRKKAIAMLEDFGGSTEADLLETAQELSREASADVAGGATARAALQIASKGKTEQRSVAQSAVDALVQADCISVSHMVDALARVGSSFATDWEEAPKLPIFLGEMVSPFVTSGKMDLPALLRAVEPYAPAGGASPLVAAAVAPAVKAGKVSPASVPLLRLAAFAGSMPSRFEMALSALDGVAGFEGVSAVVAVEKVASKRGAEASEVAAAVDGAPASVSADPAFARQVATAIVTGASKKHMRDAEGLPATMEPFGPIVARAAGDSAAARLAVIQGIVSWWSSPTQFFGPKVKTGMLVGAIQGLVAGGALSAADVTAWIAADTLPTEVGIGGGRAEALPLLRDATF